MIEKTEMYIVTCDQCSEPMWLDGEGITHCFHDESEALNAIREGDEWAVSEDGAEHYCPNCFTHDGEGNVVPIEKT